MGLTCALACTIIFIFVACRQAIRASPGCKIRVRVTFHRTGKICRECIKQ